MHSGDVLQTDGRTARFGRGGKERAKSDVVGPLLRGGAGLGQAVSRLANDDRATGGSAGFGHGQVVLSDVRAFGGDVAEQFGIVVEDERDAERGGQGVDFLGQSGND